VEMGGGGGAGQSGSQRSLELCVDVTNGVTVMTYCRESSSRNFGSADVCSSFRLVGAAQGPEGVVVKQTWIG
jgi:hypothetical protein